MQNKRQTKKVVFKRAESIVHESRKRESEMLWLKRRHKQGVRSTIAASGALAFVVRIPRLVVWAVCTGRCGQCGKCTVLAGWAVETVGSVQWVRCAVISGQWAVSSVQWAVGSLIVYGLVAIAVVSLAAVPQ